MGKPDTATSLYDLKRSDMYSTCGITDSGMHHPTGNSVILYSL